jgi:small subunit ribosomal protein S16
MAVKIRLQRRGRKKLPLYHIVIADSRSPRDGRFIENIGSYNPLTKPATIDIDRDKAFDWLMKGAEPTDTVRAILKFKGVMYRKHLSRGVAKGAMTQEDADAKYKAWVDEKEAKIAKRKKTSTDEIAAYHSKRSGSAKAAKQKVEEVAEEPVAEEVQTETATESTEASSTE